MVRNVSGSPKARGTTTRKKKSPLAPVKRKQSPATKNPRVKTSPARSPKKVVRPGKKSASPKKVVRPNKKSVSPKKVVRPGKKSAPRKVASSKRPAKRSPKKSPGKARRSISQQSSRVSTVEQGGSDAREETEAQSSAATTTTTTTTARTNEVKPSLVEIDGVKLFGLAPDGEDVDQRIVDNLIALAADVKVTNPKTGKTKSFQGVRWSKIANAMKSAGMSQPSVRRGDLVRFSTGSTDTSFVVDFESGGKSPALFATVGGGVPTMYFTLSTEEDPYAKLGFERADELDYDG